MTRTLIRGGCVLTLARANFANADVLIDGDIITEVGPGIRARDAEVVDATDAIVMPGFVDSHRHLWESLLRHSGDEMTATPDAYGPHFRPDDVYAATLVGLFGAIEAGSTSVADWCGVTAEAGHVEAALQAHADSGVRSVFAHGASSWAEGSWRPGLRAAVAAHRGPLMTMAAGPPEPRLRSLDSAAADWALARELGLRIHAHAGSSPSDRGVASAMAERHLLGDDVTLVHCSHLDDADLDAVASGGASISLTPSSEMAGGLAPSPIQRMIDRGLRPGLGSDAERRTPGDMFAQMRAVISIQHAAHFELKLSGKAGLPRLLTTRDVIRYGTLDGARAVGLGHETGSLEPGKQADVIVLRAGRPNIHPVNDPIGAVVWGMDTSNVGWVFVAGRALVQDGVIDADVERVRRMAIEARQAVAEASGILVGTGGSG